MKSSVFQMVRPYRSRKLLLRLLKVLRIGGMQADRINVSLHTCADRLCTADCIDS